MLDINDKKINWFKNARLGLFIHWGLYAVTEGYWKGKETPGIGEWIQAKEKIPTAEYEKLAQKMTCEKFNAREWAELAKKAGMKYCVFTAKHHEGFSMFDTSYDDYSIVKLTPYGKDVAKEITDAMRDIGIKPCFYYSQALDFHEKNAMGNVWDNEVPEDERDFNSYLNGKCKYQLRELLTNYGDIGLVWMDVPSHITKEIGLDLKNYVKNIQPDCLVSGRIGGDSDMGDFGCFGDNQIPAGNMLGCWETAATMNNTWGYKSGDHNFKTPKEIIELLCGLLSKGTNLLLNIGPKANGQIPEESQYILRELGKWMSVNSEAVYETEASPFMSDFTFGGVSQKNNVLYMYVYNKIDKIEIYGIQNNIKEVQVLGGKSLNFSKEDKLIIDTSNIEFDEYVTVIKVTLDKKPVITEGVIQQERDNIVLPAVLCEIIRFNDIVNIENAEHDVAVEAERHNLAGENLMFVNAAGIVENWFSEENHISWKVDVIDEGEYDLYLYTLTKKYEDWVGGHKVRLCTENEEINTALTCYERSTSANGKYFSETSSYLGKIRLNSGENRLNLFADEINQDDKAGLSVSRLIMKKNI